MKEWLLENLFSIITGLFGGGSLFAYINERRKRKIEEKQLSTDALKSMQEAYDRFTEDSLSRYNDIKEELNEVKVRLTQVTQELSTERTKYAVLLVEYDKLKTDYYALKTEFIEYKAMNEKK